jgi:hypothetical protein
LADVLLRRAALVARVALDHRPEPLAGLKVDDADLNRLLEELPGLNAPDRAVIDAIFEQARPAVEAAREHLHLGLSDNDTFCAIVRFAQLNLLEAEVFAVACAVEADPRRQRLVGYLNDDVSQRRLTLFTLELLFPEHPEVVLAASPGSGLRRAALLVAGEAGPFCSAVVAPAATVMWWLAGDRTRDPELPAGVEAVGLASSAGPEAPAVTGKAGSEAPALTWNAGPEAPAVTGKAGPEAPALTWNAGPEAPAVTGTAGLPGGARGGAPATAPRLVLVPGGDRARRRQAAEKALGGLLSSPLPGSGTAWEALVRQATLEQRGVLLELSGPLPDEAAERVSRASHLTWALASPEELPLSSLPLVPWQEVPVAPASARPEELEAAFPVLASKGALDELSLGLSAEQLELVRRAAPGVGGDLAAATRRLAAGHISAFAPRTRPSRRWEDLVLDAGRTERLREVVARCRHRRTVFGAWGFPSVPSTGVVALFSGPTGTGKTLAAEIIAGELGLDLYKVDLAALVSKWVGETEKNLSAVFAAAEASNVALFFDEADALFGKRSEVSDAHDRYANIEVAYLLQRLERYEGLVVMATNLATNIDPAFLRRVTVSVDFPLPEEPERRRIWARCLPAGAPCQDLDLGLLAQLFKLSGGSIRNAALTAGFLAADAGGPITMEILVEAVQREMRKLGRLLTPEEFGPYGDLVGRGLLGNGHRGEP